MTCVLKSLNRWKIQYSENHKQKFVQNKLPTHGMTTPHYSNRNCGIRAERDVQLMPSVPADLTGNKYKND